MIVWACSSFHVPSLSLSFYCFLGLQYSLFSHFYSALCQTFLLSYFPLVSRAFIPLISFDCDLSLSISSSHHFFPLLKFFCWLPYWPFRGPVLENEQEKVFNSFSHCIRHLKGIRLPSSKYRHSHLPCELRKGQMIRSSSTFLILEAPKIFRLFLTFF